MKKILILIAVLATATVFAQRTTRPKLTAASNGSTSLSGTTAQPYSLNPDVDSFRIAGYDKPLRSRRETFFASNYTSGTVGKVAVTITYLDENGRMLHSRQIAIPCEIPTEETRNLSIPSWDEQQSFYYIRSTVPTRVAQATPYDVTIAVDTIWFK